METNFINIILGFIEGFALIISPCILPILPIFLAGSLTGSKKRPMGIIVGFTLFFSLLVFFSHQLVRYLDVDFNLVREIGYVILLLLGAIMISNYLTEQFGKITQGFTRISTFFSSANKPEGGFWNGLFLGGIIAIIWTPCAGPILAAIIVQTAVQQTTIISFFTLMAFALGAAIPMFIISLYGKKLINTFSFFKKRATLFRKFLGGVIIASVIYMVYFEGEVISSSVNPQTGIKTSNSLINGLWFTYQAPPIQGIDAWINSPPLRLTDLHGKVVLIDFWTYSCINCLRTLPYLNDWYKRYHDKGLVIIGIHTPEFDFEKNLDNVKAAVKRYGILYPVALDNQFITWRNYKNHYWPAHYLINKKGDVVYKRFGEGEYDVMENNIRFLLEIKDLSTLKSLKDASVSIAQTPEIYLGYAKADSYYSPELIKDKITRYHFSDELSANAWSLQGLWQINAENIVAEEANAAIKIHFNARKVYAVMGNSIAKPIKVKVILTDEQSGKKLQERSILIDKYSIYELISEKKFISGYLQIIVSEPGVKVYTFTFGS
ncbi:cytochrome c biogenesis protein DipZ [Legionella anisa]|uniref:Cytochrome c biogenesis protein DipZ n=1 Tax=Legionella anisa TaxID=28082 RepID=A0AAX0WRQ9_9GAMM|nr:cytochrome c biogenesis protein DipZ [Legionella anisa]AWN75093.1 cytochrome c biogenesis protein DipZ [Legionella anisa]KTC68454.1 cytochrome C biogenesis protein [Legionella anisa]MBN5934432.1 cytochrome c biogenesis protein DipZ [Legionella anisa]MCW8424699.1 cytochrome c biogenesis protein DipZ [Legionella anisa]MCW8446182.1 cytochrome c biogenesis protein DipZ [Legionella anisa]